MLGIKNIIANKKNTKAILTFLSFIPSPQINPRKSNLFSFEYPKIRTSSKY